MGHLIYSKNEHRVQRQNLVLEWSRPIVLRYRSGKAESRPESHIRIRGLWLGNDSGRCSDRKTEWKTSLFSKDGRYIVLKASVRKAENLEEGDKVTVRLEVR